MFVSLIIKSLAEQPKKFSTIFEVLIFSNLGTQENIRNIHFSKNGAISNQLKQLFQLNSRKSTILNYFKQFFIILNYF